MKNCLALSLALLHACTLHLAFGIRFEEFFGHPFGTEHGYLAFSKGDDAVPTNSVAGVPVPDPMAFPFFCNSFRYLNVSVCASCSSNGAECVSLVLAKRFARRAEIAPLLVLALL